MMWAYIAVLAAGILLYADKSFKRTIAYAFAANLVVAIVAAKISILHGVIMFVFGCIVFTAIGYISVKKTRNREKKRTLLRTVLPIVSIGLIYPAFLAAGLGGAAILYTLLAYAGVCMLFDANLLRYLFLFDFAENVMLLLSDYMGAAHIFGLELELFLELATILSLSIFAFFTIALFRNYRSLMAWQIWK